MRGYCKPNDSKCWDCKNFAGGCSWSKEGKPVEGWTAEFSNKSLKSYRVVDCPLFEPDDDLGDLDEDGINRLFIATGDLLIHDLKIALIEYKTFEAMLERKRKRVEKHTSEFYEFFGQLVDDDMIEPCFDNIVKETDEDIKMLKKIARGEKKKDLIKKYGEDKYYRASVLWMATKSCFKG